MIDHPICYLKKSVYIHFQISKHPHIPTIEKLFYTFIHNMSEKNSLIAEKIINKI